MRFTFLGFASLLVLLFSVVNATPPHIEKANSFVGLTEVAPNDGPEIKKFLLSVGINHPASWCAAFVSYSIRDVGAISPALSPVATRFINRESVSAMAVFSKKAKVPDGAVFVMRKGNSWQGHTGFVESTEGDGPNTRLRTIEGNTSPQPGGIQAERDGDGVYKRIRKIEPWNYFRIVSFTPVRYKLAG